VGGDRRIATMESDGEIILLITAGRWSLWS
jgi:hypothetical protein